MWEAIRRHCSAGAVDAIVAGPVCYTFSKARFLPGGPRPLRSVQRPYGLPSAHLTSKENEQVKLGSHLAIQKTRLAGLAHGLGIGFVFENPEPSSGHPSMFHLHEVIGMASLPGASTVDFDQCHLGARSKKPTRIITLGVDLRLLHGQRCDNTRRQWK